MEASFAINNPTRALIVAVITKYPVTPARAAVPLSRFASPIQSPIQRRSDRFAKTTSPAWLITLKIACNTSLFNAGYVATVVGLDKAPPIPNSKPAAGKMAIGNINAFPIFCKTLNIWFSP